MGWGSQRLRPRPRPLFGEIDCQRVAAEIEIGGERAQQRLVSPPVAAPGAGDRQQQRGELVAGRAAAEDVQPVADLQFLQLAEKPVEFLQRFGPVVVGRDAAIAVDAGGAGALQDIGGERGDAARIAARGLVIFVDQPLQLGRRAVAAGAGQRRGQVVDDHRLGAPLGLGALAGVVDDERVEMRQWPQHRLGEAFGRQGQRLARQPFEGAVLAEVDHRVGAEFVGEPGIGREIGVRRRQRRVVIGRLRVAAIAARRLDQHRDIAAAKAGNAEMPAIEPARMEERVALARSPLRRDKLLHRAREGREHGGIGVELQPLLGRHLRALVARPGEQPLHQGGAVFGHVADTIAGTRQRRQDRHRRGRRVEADAVADAAVAVRVVGEHDRDPPLGRRLGAQPRPVAREVGDKGDAVGDRAIADEVGLGLGVAAERRLERDGAAEDAAVDLGQRDVHRQVAWPQPLRAGAPVFLVAAREDDLEDRAIRPQRIGAARRGDREPGGVEDHGGRVRGEGRGDERGRLAVLEALDIDRQRPQTPRGERRDQRIDRRGVPRLHQRAVEDERHDPAIAAPARFDLAEARQRLPRPVETRAQ